MKIFKRIYAPSEYIVIIANGQMHYNQYLQHFIKSAERIIVCDGAINRFAKLSITPDVIIGDCDSINNKNYQLWQSLIVKDTGQDNNDLSKALDYLITRTKVDNCKTKNVIIIGATGLREDHTIGNIGILYDYNHLFNNLSILSNYGLFNIIDNRKDNELTSMINVVIGEQISFFAFKSNTIINCQELKWPLLNYSLNNWSSGTLNQAISDTINVVANYPVCIYRAFCIKT